MSKISTTVDQDEWDMIQHERSIVDRLQKERTKKCQRK